MKKLGKIVKKIDSNKKLVYYIINTDRKKGGKKMKFDDNAPIYMQIMDLLKSQISSGEIEIGEKLPSVRDMAKKLKVNPNTIQRSYQELEREELVFTQRGMGTFATEDEKMVDELRYETAKKLIVNFVDEMRGLGYEDLEILDITRKYINREVESDEDSRDKESN